MKKTLLKSTFIVSFMTITSRITGYIREFVFAYVFGASAGYDAFLVAFKLPNFLRRLFAEGAFSQAFVPVLSEYRQNRTEEEIKNFIDRMAGAMGLVLFAVTLVSIFVAPWLVYIFAPGFVKDPSRFALATAMLRITFPYILFISLTAFVSGILNSYGKFSVPAFTPNLLNITLIIAAIFFAPYFSEPAKVLAWGVFIGGVAQLIFQLPFLRKLHLMPRPKISWKDAGVQRVLKLMLPAVFGVSVAQISLLVDTLFASFLRPGSLSWLNYSDRLTSFPLGVFGIAIATVVLPQLSRKFSNKSDLEYSQTLDWGLRFVLLIAVPATIGMVMLAGPLLTTLLQHGRFTAFDVVMARKSLIALSLGIPAFMLVKILASGFYARQNIKTPVRIAVIAMVCNIFFDVALVFPLAHAGLALATALTSTVNCALLTWTLLKMKIYQPSAGWPKFAIQLGLAGGTMFLLLWFGSAGLETWMQWVWYKRAYILAALLSAAILVYFGVLWISGVRVKEFLLKEE